MGRLPHTSPRHFARLQVAIDVKNRAEASQLKTAMGDPAVKAFALVMGTLLQLPSDRSRKRVMAYVKDYFEEQVECPQD